MTEESPALPADLLETVLAIARGLDVMGSLRRCLESAVALTRARYGALAILGPDGDVVEFLHHGVDDETRSRIGGLPTGLGLLGFWEGGDRSIRVDDVPGHRDAVGFPAHHPAMTTLAGCQITVRGQVYGRIYVSDKLGPDGTGALPFDPADAQIIEALAAAAAVAVDNARLFERTRQRERWQRAETAIDNAVLAGADAGDVLLMVAREARRLADADVAVVALPGVDEELAIEVVDVRDPAVDPAPADAATSVDRSHRPDVDPAELQAIARAWLGRRVERVSVLTAAFATGHTMSSPEPDFAATASDLGTTVAIPMRAGRRGLGVLALVWDHRATRFTKVSLEVAQAFAAQAAVTLVLADSQREREQLRVFRDRDRIARDLHDLVVQRIFATGMSLQAALRQAEVPGPVAQRLDRAVEDLNETILEIRRTIFDLQDSPSTRGGPRDRVLAEVNRAAEVLGFRPGVRFIGPVDALIDEAVADQVLAALREGLSNIGRHAGASSATVTLATGAGSVRLTVADDGVGLPERPSRRSGLANIAARAQSLGGEAEICADPAGGTRLLWWVPLHP